MPQFIEPVIKILIDNRIKTWPLLRLVKCHRHFTPVRDALTKVFGSDPVGLILYDAFVDLKPVHSQQQQHVYTVEQHVAWLRGPLRERIGEANWLILAPLLFDNERGLKTPIVWHADPFQKSVIKYAWQCPFAGCGKQLEFKLEHRAPHVVNFSKHLWKHLPDLSQHPVKGKRTVQRSSEVYPSYGMPIISDLTLDW